MKKFKNVVIGAGFSGLVATLKLVERGEDVAIVSENVGGLISNYQIKDWSFDLGGHVYTTGHSELSKILEAIGAEKHVRKAIYKSRDNGDVLYPTQFQAKKLGLELDSQDPSGKYIEGDTLQSYAERTLGGSYYNEWFAPFNHRVWTTPPEQMSADWVAGRIAVPSDEEENWGPNGEFYYAKGSKIISLLLEMIREAASNSGSKIVLVHQNVKHINRSSRTLTLMNKEKIFAHRIFSTMPITELMSARSRRELISNRVITLGVGLDVPFDADWYWAYMDVKDRGHRVSVISNHSPDNAPEGGSTLIMEIPYRKGFVEVPEALSNLANSNDHIRHGKTDAHQMALMFAAMGFGEIEPAADDRLWKAGFVSPAAFHRLSHNRGC